MKSKYLFWVLLALLIAVLGLVYFLKVMKSSDDLKDNVALLNNLSKSAREKADKAVGKEQVNELNEMQRDVRDVVGKLKASFARRDDENLDMWFVDLKTPWKSHPLVPDFQRQYELARDRLARESGSYLAEQGVKGVSSALISYDPMAEEQGATKEERLAQRAEMRRRQREFWVQDRLVRLFARVGGWLSRPIHGGESSGIVGEGTSSAAFEQTRYDVRVRVKPERVMDALHALDAPVTLNSEDGGLMVFALSAVIDNVTIKNLNPELRLLEQWEGEPPVELSFYLTILDFHERKGR